MDKNKELQEIASKHFNSIILPALRNILNQDINQIIVYITGSVSFGFADKFSDIDIELYTTNIIPANKIEEIKSVAFKNFEVDGTRLSYWPNLKKAEFDLIQTDINEFWNVFKPDQLYDISHLISLWDQISLIPKIKKAVTFYPEDVYLSVVRGLWLTINDRGLYKAAQSIERQDDVVAEIYLSDALEAILKLTYLLNGSYFPNTKWLTRGITLLKNNFGIEQFFTDYSNRTINEKLEIITTLKTSLQNYMLEHATIEVESVDNAWSILKMKKPYRIFNTF